MAQDIRDLIKNDSSKTQGKMPEGHEARFLKKLDAELPLHEEKSWSWLQLAASVVIVLGLSFGAYNYFKVDNLDTPTQVVDTNAGQPYTKSLGDISPDLKKVEDYYLASINYELSKVKLTPENKELIDGYLSQLAELNKEYKNLSLELTNSGPNELTVNALITNLKLRLNLMYRLKEQLNTLNNSQSDQKRTTA
ncbi:hypothetical protein C1T31_13585 [Hanstruepera neustonica]|uniref:Anti-sigma factor n=1 Tax=Hanstruepera neustonica TaxID=1445657 RepID=A0A2K1DVS5_9FLAO|nr:hypothetical protein [Hanstruepera neustonica]PNQ72131.1 hypothetical protein C1T31_13585 [Hanstruepera neustonica]